MKIKILITLCGVEETVPPAHSQVMPMLPVTTLQIAKL